jgi:hypothetical protein
MSFCPHCNKTINWNYRAGKRKLKLILGEPEIYVCPYCKGVITNGKKEWHEMNEEEKTSDKIKIGWSCFSGGMFWGFGGGIMISMLLGAKGGLPFVIGGVGLALFSAYYIYAYKCLIDESLERVKNIVKKDSNNTIIDILEENDIFHNMRDLLKYNKLEEYIPIFEKNKLYDIQIIVNLTENDLEKLGITIMGDRKKFMKMFSENGYRNN